MNERMLADTLVQWTGRNEQSLKFDVFSTHAVIHFDQKESRVVSLSDLLTVLRTRFDVGGMTEGKSYKLPPNTYLFQPSEGGLSLGIYLPEGMRTIKFQESRLSPVKEIKIPTPNVIISIQLVSEINATESGWRTKEAPRFFATRLTPSLLPDSLVLTSNPAEGIWDLPMPNMYGSGTGKMCYGSNSFSISAKQQNLNSMGYFGSMLYDSIFNCDLSIPSLRSRNGDPRSWINFLSTQTEFPYAELS